MADTLDVLDIGEARDAISGGKGKYDAVIDGWITAVSRRLDRLVGPIVRRTVTDELHDGGWPYVDLALWPITSVTTVTEYDGTTATVLAAESNSSKPDSAYVLEPWPVDRSLYTGHLRRRSNNATTRFPVGESNVKVTYVAGRYATTATVDEKYKAAAKRMLQEQMSTIQPTVVSADGLEVLSRRPFAVPMDVMSLLHGEIQDSPGFA